MIKYVKIPESHRPAFADRAYQVWLDEVLIGIVELQSEESWRKPPSGIRYGFRGYYRYWIASNALRERVGYHHSTRNAATQQLIINLRQERLPV